MILLLDNRDSFTFNLAHGLQALGAEVRVERAAAWTLDEVRALAPAGIVLGPGPGTPERAGCTEPVVRAAAREEGWRTPVLGICLGHQALATALGGALEAAPELLHGRRLPVHHQGTGLFTGLPLPLELAHYNSLVVRREGLPEELEVTAQGPRGEVAGLRHRSAPLEGLQAHPESILSLDRGGLALLRAFLARCARSGASAAASNAPALPRL